MNFVTHNEKPSIDTNCTSLVGYVDARYGILKRAFGEPTGGCDKSDAEWLLEFEDGKVATIYNYKDGYNYCGSGGLPVQRITSWHIGGHDAIVGERVQELVRAMEERFPKRQKKIRDFHKIRRETHYYDIFLLEDRPLVNGSRIFLKWPNGSVKRVEVRFETVRTGEGSDVCYVSHLMVPARIRGLATYVDLTLEDCRDKVSAAWADKEE